MQPIWILGGGKFGLKAAKALGRNHPAAAITVVEKNRHTCWQLANKPFNTVCMDGVRYLDQNLGGAGDPEWIVPAIPLHVAYGWIQAKISVDFDLQALAVPFQLVKVLPNPIPGGFGEMYISNADFTCPENCAEPDEICTFTGEPRPRILHEFMANICYRDFQPVVVCSRQLSTGIGGYRPGALFAALDRIKTAAGPVILTTACRCHGVMQAFKISKKS